MMDKGKSIQATLCGLALLETDAERYKRISCEELKETGRVRFRLTPHGFGNYITHWHMRHFRSNILFIILGETGR